MSPRARKPSRRARAPGAFPPGGALLEALARALETVRLVDPERDPIERLDRLEVVTGDLRYAGTSASGREAAEALVARLARALAPVTDGLEHGLRLVDDDRPEILLASGAPAILVRGLGERRMPLALAFTWRHGDRPPPTEIARLSIGPLLGYPRCCVAFEEARRARLVVAEGRGMLETWRPRTSRDVTAAIDARRPFLVDEGVADEGGRIERLRRFPFVSFVPCLRCCERGAASPAGKLNDRRRALADRVAPKVARAIRRTRGG